MRIRPAARLFVLSADNRVLLFRFQHTDDALTGRQYWLRLVVGWNITSLSKRLR